MTHIAAALVAASLALLCAVLVDELAVDAKAAGAGRPTRAGPYLIVWADTPSRAADLRCYVARKAEPARAGVWLCG